jgi:hypothetical protein
LSTNCLAIVCQLLSNCLSAAYQLLLYTVSEESFTLTALSLLRRFPRRYRLVCTAITVRIQLLNTLLRRFPRRTSRVLFSLPPPFYRVCVAVFPEHICTLNLLFHTFTLFQLCFRSTSHSILRSFSESRVTLPQCLRENGCYVCMSHTFHSLSLRCVVAFAIKFAIARLCE